MNDDRLGEVRIYTSPLLGNGYTPRCTPLATVTRTRLTRLGRARRWLRRRLR